MYSLIYTLLEDKNLVNGQGDFMDFPRAFLVKIPYSWHFSNKSHLPQPLHTQILVSWTHWHVDLCLGSPSCTAIQKVPSETQGLSKLFSAQSFYTYFVQFSSCLWWKESSCIIFSINYGRTSSENCYFFLFAKKYSNVTCQWKSSN